MDKNEFQILKDVQAAHWWWKGRELIVKVIIKKLNLDLRGKKIADAGCGYGSNLAFLTKYGRIHCLEPNKEALSYVKNHWKGKVITHLWKSPESVNEKFDMVFMTDVLEHIQDDAMAIKWISNHLEKNGIAILTVPAHNFLWSQMDEVVHHYRRYSKQEILGLIDGQLNIEYISFYNLFLFPLKILFLIFDRFQSMFKKSLVKRSYNNLPSWPLNILLFTIMKLESYVHKFSRVSFGVSMIIVLRKR